MVAEVAPEISRPTSRNHRVGDSAITNQSTPVPRLDARITGRRPTLSDSAPMIGWQKNCVTAQVVPDTPTHQPALAMDPVKLVIRAGHTGMTRPRPMTSSNTVIITKPKAALRTLIPDGGGISAGGPWISSVIGQFPVRPIARPRRWFSGGPYTRMEANVNYYPV